MVDSIAQITEFASSGTKIEPGTSKEASGYVANEQLPAEHFNWFMSVLTSLALRGNPGIRSVILELKNLLTLASLTPDAGSTTQVKAALDVLYQAHATGANWATALAAALGANWAGALNAGLGTNWATAFASALGAGWAGAFGGTMGTPLQSTGTQVTGSFDTSSTAPSHTTRLNFDGAFWATTINTPSTKEIKKDIEEFKESALEVINSVKVVSYTLIADEAKEKQIGFIAEDTDARLAGENHDSVKIGNTLGLLIKAVQELAARVEVLEARYGSQLSV